jgi:hypothetical protein
LWMCRIMDQILNGARYGIASVTLNICCNYVFLWLSTSTFWFYLADMRQLFFAGLG